MAKLNFLADGITPAMEKEIKQARIKQNETKKDNAAVAYIGAIDKMRAAARLAYWLNSKFADVEKGGEQVGAVIIGMAEIAAATHIARASVYRLLKSDKFKYELVYIDGEPAIRRRYSNGGQSGAGGSGDKSASR